jgi:hypothetical protein
MVYYKIGNEELGYIHSYHDYSKAKVPKMHTIKAEKKMQQVPTYIMNSDAILKKTKETPSEYPSNSFVL